MSKHLNWSGPRENHAKRNRKTPPPPTHLWIISSGRPRALIKALGMVPMEGWPAGCWKLPGDWNVHLVVVRELPETQDTLFLRLLGHRTTLVRAIRELDALPPASRTRRVLTHVLLAWREEIFKTIREGNMLLPETKARYVEWERQVLQKGRKEGIKEGVEKGRQEGIKEGVEKGVKKGRKKGRQEIVLKMLALRFGPLPAAAERRVKRASLATLETWAERLLIAQSLDDVFAH